MPRDDEHIGLYEFEPEDFDAYLPEKWNSNMFTLQRRKVKAKLEAIGHNLEQVLQAAEVSLVMNLSDEFPSLWNKKSVDTQWLFFSRDEAAKAELTDLIDREKTLADTLADPTPRYRHVFLGMAVNTNFLEIGLRLHYDAWVDRRNLLNLLKDADGRQGLVDLLGQLPEHYEMVLNDTEPVSPPSLQGGDIEKLASSFSDERGWLFIGARLPRDQVPVLGSEVVETAREVFRFLSPLYHFFAWSQDNDAISLANLVAEREEALKASRAELDREKAKREQEAQIKLKRGLKLREEIEEKVLETKAWRQRELAARRAAAARAASQEKQEEAKARAEALAAKWEIGKTKKDEEAAGKHEEKAREPKRTDAPPKKSPSKQHTRRSDTRGREKWQKPRGDKRRREQPRFVPSNVSPERAADIQVGDLVEIKKGFLAGRRGVVNEIDDKGGVKVNFGPLSSRLALNEVKGHGPVSTTGRGGAPSSKRTHGA